MISNDIGFILRMKKTLYYKPLVLLLIFLLAAGSSSAHVVVNELEKMSSTETATLYLRLGFQHIIPLGLDHILFVLSLFLLSPKLKPIVFQSTAFTVAHTITLALAMYHVVSPPARVIEPLISLSILFVALENIFSPRLKPTRIGLVFLFGLVHGLGFASSLNQMGLPQNAYLSSLLLFNVGVELGQLTIILLAFFLVGKWFGEKTFYRRLVVLPISLVIILIAGYWTVERIFG
jgi:hypothetical protein